MSNFGQFINNGSEYSFSRVDTPRPMMNYIWNDRILSGVNHLGGGVGSYGGRTAAYIDPDGKGRCSIIKNGNRYFYIRDEQTGEIWNPGWYPVKRSLDSYNAVHGLGYSTIEGSYNGIRVKTRVFVNSTDPVEIWTVTVRNESGKVRTINVYPFVEYTLSGYPVYCNYYSMVYSQFDPHCNMLVAHNKAQERPHKWYGAFIASSITVTGYESSHKSFFGTYGDITAPEAIKAGKLSNSIAVGEDMVGVLENTFTLNAGEEFTYHVLIGATDTNERAAEMVQAILEPGKIDAAFESHISAKRKMCGDIVVDTPNSVVNNISNIWLKQQVQLCAEVGRDTGKGFRDQLQDAWAVASFNHLLARDKILETLKYEYSDGRCVRGWLPLDNHIYSDGPTWIAPTVNAYIKETGDTAFLKIRVPYLDGGDGTVWEHILTAVRYSSGDTGVRNLVRAHAGDWNDSLNGIGVGGKGESVWTSIALYYALCNVSEMSRDIFRDMDLEKEMQERAARIKETVNDTGWDGEWYLAGYTDAGDKVGSHLEKEGSIYLNSQTWSVMSGVAEGERAELCLKAVREKLDSPYGPLTLYPTYTKYNPQIGRLTGFIPGIWENGTPYCHGGTFKIVADCCAGLGDDAYETMMKIIPDSTQNPSDYSGCEPYALTNMYFGPDNPKAGQTMFAWVTGTAGWMFRAVTQYMMGFYPGYDSITIKPCIPHNWDKCTLRRVYRGDTYIISIVNKSCERNKGRVGKITLDGIEIEGSSFKIAGDGKEHTVNVEMI